MPSIPVEKLTFDFEDEIDAQKYDEWTQYLQVINKPPASQKAIDVLAVSNSSASTVVWFIEAKDFRIIDSPPKPSNLTGLHATMAAKVRDTLAGLHDAAAYASVQSEKLLAKKAITADTKRVVLHLEPYTGAHTALFPKGFAASVLQKLRQLVKAIDPNPLVLNIANTSRAEVPWAVR